MVKAGEERRETDDWTGEEEKEERSNEGRIDGYGGQEGGRGRGG